VDGLHLLSCVIYQYILDRNRNSSELIGETTWKLDSQWSLSANLFWDTEKSELDRSLLELGYRETGSNNSLTFGYLTEENHAYVEFDSSTSSAYLIDRDISQAFVRGQWQIGEQWGLVFGLQEDLVNNRNLDRLFGVSYESCCWNITLGWRDRLERSINDGLVVNDPGRGKSVILSFEFFGLGGVGRSGTELMQSP
ncbi:MAG: LPS assembly protein LptD, partial [Gammaproteobacteria bacterium]